MSLLVLGGTAQGRQLAARLHNSGVPVIYSLVGLVTMPALDCEIISGGFTQRGGLSAFIQQRRVRAVLDATHPYAQRMSIAAASAAQACGIPCWRFQRPAWRQKPGDQWQMFDEWQALIFALKEKRSVFLTSGQLDAVSLRHFSVFARVGQRQLLRTAAKPTTPLPAAMSWIGGIGPFHREDEHRLMAEHRIDALVCKNSGGSATAAKLVAARERGLPVFMLARPELPAVDTEFSNLANCETFVKHWMNRSGL